jgi:hypothetical protein
VHEILKDTLELFNVSHFGAFAANSGDRGNHGKAELRNSGFEIAELENADVR